MPSNKPFEEPAFPTIPKNHGYENADGTGSGPGMSLRDYFAAKAMQVILDRTWDTTLSNEQIANSAYDMADAMIKAR
jgi:hypothetical protein